MAYTTAQLMGALLTVDGRATEGGIIDLPPGARLLLDVISEGQADGALLDEIGAALDTAAASAESASASAALASVISGLTGEDEAVRTLMDTPTSQVAQGLSDTIASVLPRGFDTWETSANRSLTPGELTASGHPITLRSDANSSGFKVVDGVLAQTPLTIGPGAASYLGVVGPSRIKSMWAKVKWIDDGHSASELLCLVASGTPFTQGPGYPNAAAHVLFHRGSWGYDIYKTGLGPETLASDSYAALPFDTEHLFTVDFDGDSATLGMPTYPDYTVTDPRILSYRGQHATIELYSSTTPANRLVIVDWGFEAEVPSRPTVLDVPLSYSRNHFVPTAYAAVTGGFTQIAAGGFAMPVRFPASGRLLVTLTTNIEVADVGAGDRLLIQPFTENGAGGSTGVRASGLASVANIVEGPPNSNATLDWNAWAIGCTATIFAGGDYGDANISAVPLA